MSKTCVQFFAVCLMVALAVMTGNTASAGVNDYGLMWANQCEDTDADGTYNRYNMHGGGLTDIGYANDAWVHTGGMVWGKQSTFGGWQVAYTQFDKYGNNVWTDLTGLGDQVYGRGFATNGTTVVGTGLNRYNMETQAAGRNAYVVKYDGSGDLLDPGRVYANSFDKNAASAGDPWGRAAWINPTNGDVWTTGYAQGDLDRPLGTSKVAYTGAGDRDQYIIKHNADGSVKFGFMDALSTGTEIPGGILSDATGNIYVAGGTNGSIDTNVNAGGYDMYIAKYDALGTRQWVQQMGGPENEFVYSMKWTADGNIILSGDMSTNIDGTTFSGGTGQDAYVRVLDTDGNLVWNDQFGTTGDDLASGLSFDDNGNIWTGGTTGGDLAATLGGVSDVFWRQYAPDGTVLQTIQLPNAGDEQGIGAAVDGNPHRLYIGGGIVNGHWPGYDDPQGTHVYFAAEAQTLKVTAGDFYSTTAAALGTDGLVNWDDVQAVADAVQSGIPFGTTYDLNSDGASTFGDVEYFVEELFERLVGDTNFDNDVDVWAIDGTGDAQVLSSNLGTMTGMTWADGDFNLDGDVDVWAFDGTGDAQLLSSNLGATLDAPAGTAMAVYNAVTGELSFDIGEGVAVVGLQADGLDHGAVDDGSPLGAPAQNAAKVLAYFNAAGLETGMSSVGNVLPVGLTEGDIAFSYTPIGGASTVVPVTVIVPEPSTIAMLLVVGALALCWRRRSA